jgi:hypothetical protein
MNPTEQESQSFFAQNPVTATPPPLVTIAQVAARLGKSRSRLKEICGEIGLEPIRAAGSAAWLFDDSRIHRLENELARRERESQI